MLQLPAGLRQMQSSSAQVWRGSPSQRALSQSYHTCRTPASGASHQQSWLLGGTCGALSIVYAASIPQVRGHAAHLLGAMLLACKSIGWRACA